MSHHSTGPLFPDNSLETMGARSFAPSQGTELADVAPSEVGTPSQATTPVKGPPFILEGCFARGGMGEVWSATQQSLRRTVAIKKVRADRGGGSVGEAMEEVLRHEGIISGALEHPNIVPVHDLTEDDYGRPMIAMKLVHGEPWSDVLRRDFEDLQPEELLAKNLPILASLVRAVAFAHARGVIHRDLKPSQVMIGEFGEVLLMDWGLAVVADEEAMAKCTAPGTVDFLCPLTQASNPSGTPSFMAPEQTDPHPANLGYHTDVYLLGGILYLLLTGAAPHRGSTSTEALRRARMGDVEHPSSRAKDRYIPRELANLCMMALEPAPAQRIASANLFLSRLEDYLSGESRRAESNQLVNRAAELLQSCGDSYAALGEIVSDLIRARLLWPGSHEARQLMNKTLSRYSRTAARNGDLALARLQAERMDDGGLRRATLEEVERAEGAARRMRSTRLVAVAGSLILLLVVLAGGSALSMQIREERNSALSAEHEAASLRSRAESDELEARSADEDSIRLVDFILSDLRTRVAAVDPELRMLDEAANRSLTYYRNRVGRSEGPEESAAIAARLAVLQGIFFEQGNMVEAEATARMAEDLLRQAVAQYPDNAAVQAAISMNQLGLVDLVHARGGETSEKISMVKAELDRLSPIMDRITSLREGGGPPPELLHAKVSLLYSLAGSLILTDTGEAVKVSAEALAGAREYLQIVGAGDTTAKELVAKNTWYHSVTLANHQELEEAHAAALAAVELYEDAVETAPDDRRRNELTLELAKNLNHTYVLGHQLGGPHLDFGLLHRSLAELRKLREDPSFRLAVIQPFALGLLNLIDVEEDPEVAWSAVQELLEMLEPMVEKDPTNAVRRNQLARAYQSGSTVAQKRNDIPTSHAMALRAYRETDLLCRMRPSMELWRYYRIELAYRVMCTYYSVGEPVLSAEFLAKTLELLDAEIALGDEEANVRWNNFKELAVKQFEMYYPSSSRPDDE